MHFSLGFSACAESFEIRHTLMIFPPPGARTGSPPGLRAKPSAWEVSIVRELRIHGRGGQGAVVASKILAAALFRESRSVQSFPAFGVERRGAPVAAFLRVSDTPILLRCEVTAPDDLIVLDPTLIVAVDVTQGLKPGGMILINSERAPETYPKLTDRFHVITVDAGGIAMRHGLGSRTQPIVNTAILGAFARCSGLVSLDSICAAIQEEVPGRAAQNVAAAREAAEAAAASEVAQPAGLASRYSRVEVKHA